MNNDGHCLLEISPDGMLARGTFTPATAEGRALGMDDVDYELRAAGLVDGILWEVIRRSLEDCNNNSKVVRDVVIGRGVHPRPEMPAVLIFPPRIQALDPVFLPPERQEQNAAFSSYFAPASTNAAEDHHDVGAVDEHGNIDFRETHGVFVIQKDQVLAAARQAIEGIPGRTVRGEYVAFQTLKVNPMTPGPNTEMRGERLYATKNGRLVWNSSQFGVDENLELTTDVGYKTGNIRFPGNLILKAGIKDRFKVWVGGNLDATGVVDAYEVFCGGNLEAKAGIIGRGKGLVRTKGMVNTRFVENCVVESLGAITIETSSLHAHLYSSDLIKTSEKGKLVGGESHALKGMEVNHLGNAAGTRTEIFLGRDYVMERKLEFVNDKYQEIMLTIQKMDERLQAGGADPAAASPSILAQRKHLEEEGAKYQAMMGEVAGSMVTKEDAALLVKGTCFPGVVVDICGTTLEISKEQKAVKFTLDKAHDKIVISSLTKPKD